MSKNNLSQYEDGQNLEHSPQCWRSGNSIVNMHNDYVKTKEDIDKYCGACPNSSVCVGIMANYTSSFNERKWLWLNKRSLIRNLKTDQKGYCEH